MQGSAFKLEHCMNSWLQSLETYQAGKSFDEVISEHGFVESDILKIASNETTLGTSPKAIAAAKAALDKSHFYDDPFSSGFTQHLEKHFAEQGLDMSKIGVVVGNGMDYIIDLLGKLFLDQNSSIIQSPPTFIYYKLLADWAGSEVINVAREADYSIDADKILAAVKDNTRIVFICSPNNPTGNIADLEQIEKLAANLNCILFVDHAYIEFTDSKYDASKLIEKYPNLIIGRTFSKAYAMAGYRVGYGLMSKAIKDRYMTVIAPFANTRASLAGAKAALEDRDHLNKVVQNNNSGKEFLYKELERLGFNYLPTEANFILMDDGKTQASELTEKLLKKAVIVRPMASVSPYSIRVTIGTESENQRFIKTLEEIV